VVFDRGPQIWRINASGKGARPLTSRRERCEGADWAPTGDRIAFMRWSQGETDIYVMQRDGRKRRRLTRTHGADEDPAWSPDGGRIAFASERTGNYELYV
jgi:TolB protein